LHALGYMNFVSGISSVMELRTNEERGHSASSYFIYTYEGTTVLMAAAVFKAI